MIFNLGKIKEGDYFFGWEKYSFLLQPDLILNGLLNNFSLIGIIIIISLIINHSYTPARQTTQI